MFELLSGEKVARRDMRSNGTELHPGGRGAASAAFGDKRSEMTNAKQSRLQKFLCFVGSVQKVVPTIAAAN